MVEFSLPRTWISSPCPKLGNPTTVDDSRIFATAITVQGYSHTKQCSAMDDMKRVDGYGSLKSYEIEYTSQPYETLVNCSSYFSLPYGPFHDIPNSLLFGNKP